MNENKMRGLRASAWLVTVFSVLLLLAGAAQLTLGGVAVKQHYDTVKAEQAKIKHNRYYGYDSQYEFMMEYGQSSSAFLNPARFNKKPEMPEYASAAGIASIVLLVSALGFMIMALVWVWRAHANLAAHGIRAKYTAGRAVATYLIPMANLVLPFEAMRELYNRSHGEDDERAHESVDDVTAWWSALAIGLLLFSGMIVKFGLDAASNVYIMTPLWMEYIVFAFAILLILGSAYLFSQLARTITRAQEEYFADFEPEAVTEAAPVRRGVTLVGG